MPFRAHPPLREGQGVAVVAPSSPFPKEAFEAGCAAIEHRYRVTVDEAVFAVERYLAGNVAHRTEAFQRAFGSDAAAIFAARGGYGSMHLLSSLDWSALTPKLLVGFSDITALHLAALSAGWISIHGPVLTQLGRQPEPVRARLFHLLEKSAPAAPLDGQDCYVGGTAEGPLIGGNLSVFAALLGSSFMPDLTGAVLLLEDVGERPYRLDRLWTQLTLNGVFKKVSGIVLGDFTDCEEKGASYTSADVLRDLAQRTGLPCAAGFRIGHGEINMPVPLGARVRLEADRKALQFLEPAVREANVA